MDRIVDKRAAQKHSLMTNRSTKARPGNFGNLDVLHRGGRHVKYDQNVSPRFERDKRSALISISPNGRDLSQELSSQETTPGLQDVQLPLITDVTGVNKALLEQSANVSELYR